MPFCSCDYNKYTLQYISTLGEVCAKKKKVGNVIAMEEVDEESEEEVIYNSDVEI